MPQFWTRLGSDGSSQVIVNMTAYNKVTGSGATMARLEKLGNDIIDMMHKLKRKMEKTALTLFDKVKEGFFCTGSITKDFVTDMSKQATNFFMDAWEFKAQLDTTDTQALCTALEGLQ